MKKENPDKQKTKIKIGIGAFALSCILLGFIIYIGTDYTLSLVEKKEFSLLVTVIKGVSSIAINLIVIAFISLLLELTSIKDYIHYMLHQIIIDVENLISNKYTWDYSALGVNDLKQHLDILLLEIVKKEREKSKIHISTENKNILEMSHVILPKLINNFVLGEYYEDYNINVRISIEDETLIKFIVTTSYIVNNSRIKSFQFHAMYPTKKSYMSLHFDQLLIYSKDGKELYYDLTSEINNNIHLVNTRDKHRHHNVYCVESNAEYSNLTHNDYFVEYTRSYLKYIKNGVFVHSLSQPVKNFQAEIILENDTMNKYKLYGLSFYPYKQVHNQTDLRMKEQNNGSHSLTIHNSNWCFPGTGFSITLMENLDSLENDS